MADTAPNSPDIVDRLLGQPHTTSEPAEVTAQREALMTEVIAEIRHLRETVGLQDAVKTLAKQVKAALDAYEAAEKAAAEKAAADAKAAQEKAAADAKHAAEAQHANKAETHR
jgi:hypothetical protein